MMFNLCVYQDCGSVVSEMNSKLICQKHML